MSNDLHFEYPINRKEKNMTDVDIAKLVEREKLAYAELLIAGLEKEDLGRKKSRHKTSIEYLKRLNMRPTLRAEIAGLIEEPEDEGFSLLSFAVHLTVGIFLGIGVGILLIVGGMI